MREERGLSPFPLRKVDYLNSTIRLSANMLCPNSLGWLMLFSIRVRYGMP